MANAPRQIEELKQLRREFKGEGVFEFLGPKPADATEANPTRLRIGREAPAPMRVSVAMPVGYPAEAPPAFKVEGSLGDAEAEAIEELLATQASYMKGMECISTVLQSLDDLDLASLDLGTPGRCRSIWKVDLVNNSPKFTKSLKSAACGRPCVWFFRNIECQNNAKFSFAVEPLRAVYVVCDSPDKKSAVEYMKTIRTDGDFDADMLGKPAKVQVSVVEEFEMAPRAVAVEDGFSSAEYRTDEDFNSLMDPYLAATAGCPAKK
uniref:RWD domain-containing protein n=1 Tax=Alexandrium catenella TaxID=2925 RepID=A0A7S1QRS1_ALECA|mmetsp:Transcript_37659/g.101899  ORF Transcript_37659/g.101899 Transcript_37659/m.101899 type:complete len:264 (+) Transcript_37659:74-865(+)|eukprot:CAMPEP_0171192566 /NCGR_PEP_ID=MMETSP0790-20130122/19934_1 /TAXON_ID=2925 /ORGANISM="Alexandrium catenella, Strain OF101" /LENGTH=263 /DNA_ID=CAMNT_0011657725 /DNA_START=49 /DNA_END=840 /DNA_ORIENTATION=-